MRTLKNLSARFVYLFLFIGLVCTTINAQANLPTDFDNLIRSARNNGTVKVIVGFRLGDYRTDAKISEAVRAKQRFDISQKQSSLLNRLRNFDVSEPKRFNYIPFLAMEVSADALAVLRESADVVSIQEDAEHRPSLVQTIPLLGGSAAGGANGGTFGGFSGLGRTVAILDTGVDKLHPFFNNRVVSEACFSTNGATSTSFCPGGANSSTAVGSGVNCSVEQIAACSHGTHVAGIAAGGNPQITGNGVARNANIIAVQVFSRSTNCGQDPSPCARAFTSDVILGLERVFALRSAFAIDAVNLSISEGRYFGFCDAEQAAYKTAIDNLRSVGIATVVAAGNNGFTDSLSAPACVSSAVSVGSTKDSSPVDGVSIFSNSASFLRLFAPGETVTSSIPGGAYQDVAGTSQAAAHVTGAFAVLRQKFPNDTVTQNLGRLRTSGVQVTDSRNSVVKTRIKIDTALNAAAGTGECLFCPLDFNGDGAADLSVYRPSDATWYVRPSSVSGAGNFYGVNFGLATDKLTPADYDGDGKTDIAVWRDEPSNPDRANFYILQSTNNTLRTAQFGRTGDNPSIVGDWDGDGKADPSVYRNGAGGGQSFFFYRPSSQPAVNFVTVSWGSGGDIPMRGDFDGDRKQDAAVFRPANNTWYILQSTTSQPRYDYWGTASDKFVSADYDGDGKTDLAVFRSGIWYIKQSFDNQPRYVNFGLDSDLLVPADYDGDGKTDIAVYRSGVWYRLRSQQGFDAAQFGGANDKPIPAAFVP